MLCSEWAGEELHQADDAVVDGVTWSVQNVSNFFLPRESYWLLVADSMFLKKRVKQWAQDHPNVQVSNCRCHVIFPLEVQASLHCCLGE